MKIYSVYHDIGIFSPFQDMKNESHRKRITTPKTKYIKMGQQNQMDMLSRLVLFLAQ